MRPVEPAREANQQPFHELAQIVHPVGETGVDLRQAGLVETAVVPSLSRLRQFRRHPGHKCLGIECPEALQQQLVAQPTLRHRRDFQQDMEMVGHDAVRQNPAAGKVLIHPQIHPERLAFPFICHLVENLQIFYNFYNLSVTK
ncbi:MAG: hypothetical protein WED15_07610 [Akkermansiaceae bacterium]